MSTRDFFQKQKGWYSKIPSLFLLIPILKFPTLKIPAILQPYFGVRNELFIRFIRSQMIILRIVPYTKCP